MSLCLRPPFFQTDKWGHTSLQWFTLLARSWSAVGGLESYKGIPLTSGGVSFPAIRATCWLCDSRLTVGLEKWCRYGFFSRYSCLGGKQHHIILSQLSWRSNPLRNDWSLSLNAVQVKRAYLPIFSTLLSIWLSNSAPRCITKAVSTLCQRDTRGNMLTAALFTVAKMWNHLKCLS